MLTSMKSLIIKMIDEYPRCLYEKALFQRHLDARENRDMRHSLMELETKIAIIESWFALLDADEKFAIRQTLNGTSKETAAMQAAAIRWMWAGSHDGETPWQIRERAIAKIVASAQENEDTLHTVFG